METSEKVILFESAASFYSQLKQSGKRVVQCHGTFDLIHPGHIVHFEEAKALGDLLVVTITGEAHVNKGPGRPYFNDAMRVRSLSALACVDYVTVIPHRAAVEAIECVCPSIYCKGKEYEDPESDVTGNIHEDVRTVERLGGEVHYVGSVVFSSTRLINHHFDAIPDGAKDFCRNLSQRINGDRFKQLVDDFARIKVLVIGDIIFDRYSYVSVQGLTSKNRIISARFLEEETHLGGSLAIYRHLRAFTEQVDLLSITGTEGWVKQAIDGLVPSERNHVLTCPCFTTVVKQRYVERSKRSQEISKLFAINYIDAKAPNGETENLICERLAELLPCYDLVVVADFGHGLMQNKVRELVQDRAPFLALNCQTNSNNHGFNLIDRQYRRVDAFTLDDQELMLSCGKRHPDHLAELQSLKIRLGARYAWLTRGANETIGVAEHGPAVRLPVLEKQVTDTVGAGDALFSIAALAACSGYDLELGTLMGQLAGAQAVNIVGNASGIRKDTLLKGGMALLNF